MLLHNINNLTQKESLHVTERKTVLCDDMLGVNCVELPYNMASTVLTAGCAQAGIMIEG